MHPVVERLRQHIAGQKVPPPASSADIAEAEGRIGFTLPHLLRELYGNIADGGFGPSHGFLPLLTPDSEGMGCESVVHLYTLFRGDDPGSPCWFWPERLLPVLDWGCAILS